MFLYVSSQPFLRSHILVHRTRWQIHTRNFTFLLLCVLQKHIINYVLLKEVEGLGKVHIFWEGYKIFSKSPPYFCLQYILTKVKWRFRKILWPSKNIWTLIMYIHNLKCNSNNRIFEEFRCHLLFHEVKKARTMIAFLTSPVWILVGKVDGIRIIQEFLFGKSRMR